MQEEKLDECPYGANDCPKINKLEEMLYSNAQELKVVNKNIVAINTTLKNTAYVIGIIVALVTALIGLVVL